MELISNPQSSAQVWEHKPNERGEIINVNEPVCRLCFKTVATKRGNTTNLKSHLKHNPPSFSTWEQQLQLELGRGFFQTVICCRCLFPTVQITWQREMAHTYG